MHVENLGAVVRIRQPHRQVHAETAGAQRGRIDEAEIVGGSDDEDLALLIHAVQLREYLAYHALGRPGALIGQGATR